MIKCVQGVIEADIAIECEWLCIVDLQRLVDRTDWIYVDADTIFDEAFEEALSDHPDLCDAVNAQVSVWCQSFK